MATYTITITISDEDSAKAWLAEVQEINEEYKRVMEEAANTLTSAQEVMSGTLVDELVGYAQQLMNAAQQTFEALDAIADTVNDVLSKVSTFIEDAAAGVKNLVGKIFG